MLLAIDTCGVLGGVALAPIPDSLHPQPSESWFRELSGKTFSERLIAAIAEILDEAGISPDQLTGIVVVHGPGSFTGIRIGVSAAKGLAEVLEIPLMAVSRLELLARKASGDGAIAVLDAGRGEFFVGVYRFQNASDWVQEGEALLTRDGLEGSAANSGLPVVVCEAQVFSALPSQRPELVAPPTAIDALAVGSERFRRAAFDDVATLDANYLRRSETEMLARIAERAAIRAGEAVPPE